MHKEIARFPFEGKEAIVFVTDEYKRFKFIPENRNPDLAEKSNAHSRQIEESIQQNGYLLSLPIVNGEWKVIDGQHRIAALRELHLPVYVVKMEGYNGPEIQALNSANKNWDKENYANYWSKKGRKDYTDLLEMHKEFPRFKVGTMATLLSNAQARKKSIFNYGHWQVKRNLKTTRLHLAELMELADIQPKAITRACAEAFLSVAAHGKYNHRRMKENMDSYGPRYWENHSDKEEFIVMFSNIFNHARPIRNKVEFATPKDMEVIARRKMKRAA